MSRGKALFTTRVAVGLLAASMQGAQLVFPSNVPVLKVPASCYEPPDSRNIRRRRRRETSRKAAMALGNTMGFAINRAKRMERRAQTNTRNQNAVVAKMTNWQRTKWARAGYPGGLKNVEKFAAMQRRTA